MEEIAKNWLKTKIDEFIDQFDPEELRDEFYLNDYEIHRSVLASFYTFIDKESREKEQAWHHAENNKRNYLGEDTFGWEHSTKLIELTIQECVQVMEANAIKAEEDYTYLGDDVPTSDHIYKIKQHFGVK